MGIGLNLFHIHFLNDLNVNLSLLLIFFPPIKCYVNYLFLKLLILFHSLNYLSHDLILQKKKSKKKNNLKFPYFSNKKKFNTRSEIVYFLCCQTKVCKKFFERVNPVCPNRKSLGTYYAVKTFLRNPRRLSTVPRGDIRLSM